MKNQHQQQVKTEIEHVQTWSGPLPAPESLIKYNEAAPGAADKIIAMAESEMQHRHELEKKALADNSRLAFVSTILGFLSIIVLSVLVGFAIYQGNSGLAFGAIIGAIAAVAGLFTYSKVKSNRDTQQ